MIKIKETKRRFYNKWLYKVSLQVRGIAIFRMKSYSEIQEFCSGPGPTEKPDYWNRIFRDTYYNRDTIRNLAAYLESLAADEFATRIERDSIDVYLNDKNISKDIQNKFAAQLLSVFEPKNPELLISDEKTIMCNKLPHNKYRYKVYLRPHKMAHDVPNKKIYLNWLSTQSEHVLISDAVKKWFIETDWNWDRRYMYVEDKSTLLLLNLRNSEVLGQVYEYIITDK